MEDDTKFGRRCELSIEVKTERTLATGGRFTGENNNNIVIHPEFTIEFEVVRNSAASSQTATFKIYNLGDATRRLIFADSYDTGINCKRRIQFRAGYVGFTPLIFNGFMRQASSKREGVNMITTIEAYDGGLAMALGFTSRTVIGGTPASDLLASLAASLPTVQGNAIVGAFPRTSQRGRVLLGNTWTIIREESDRLAMIDNGQVKILQLNEAINSDIPVITSESGLLSSPARSGAMIQFDMLFEPRFTIGQLVELRSSTNRLYNGTYKVMGFTHSGTISPAVAGPAKTTVNLWVGTRELQLIEGQAIT